MSENVCEYQVEFKTSHQGSGVLLTFEHFKDGEKVYIFPFNFDKQISLFTEIQQGPTFSFSMVMAEKMRRVLDNAKTCADGAEKALQLKTQALQR